MTPKRKIFYRITGIIGLALGLYLMYNRDWLPAILVLMVSIGLILISRWYKK